MFWVPLAAAAISAAASYASAKGANRQQTENQEDAQQFNAEQAELTRQFNEREAEKQRVWSASQAQEQMDFQKSMSDTAVRRSVADMRAAGLNPILASSPGGGASTPSGAMGQASAASASSASSPGAPGAHKFDVSNLLSSALQYAQVKNVEAQTEETEARRDKTHVETSLLRDELPENWDRVGDEAIPRSMRGREAQARVSEIWQRARTLSSQEGLNNEEKALVSQRISNAIKEGDRIEADTGNTKADTVLKQLQQAEAKAWSDLYKKFPEAAYGEVGGKIAGSAINSALNVKRLFGSPGLRLRH